MLHHGAGLRRLLTVGKVPEDERETLIAALSADHRAADISSADRAMLDYVRKLTETPREITEADVDSLRRRGFDDRGVHDICSIAAYFAFVNRIADGLGVELEARFESND